MFESNETKNQHKNTQNSALKIWTNKKRYIKNQKTKAKQTYRERDQNCLNFYECVCFFLMVYMDLRFWAKVSKMRVLNFRFHMVIAFMAGYKNDRNKKVRHKRK